MPSVAKAEKQLYDAKGDKEYLPITVRCVDREAGKRATLLRKGEGADPQGLADFTKLAAELAYGKDSAPIKENRLAITQSISGTGALRIGTAFLARFYPGTKAIYLPTPTWGNHIPIAKDSGLEVKQYKYFDKDTVGLDFEGMKRDIESAPEGSAILLHACAHVSLPFPPN